MSEAAPINIQAFAPFKGGRGRRFTASVTSSAVQIPGLTGGVPAPDARVLISNSGVSGNVSAFILLGDANVVADAECLELMPGAYATLTPPTAGPGGIWLAAITESSSVKISVISGTGS